ncbi:MAG: DNA primase [bacterium]|nr:DNA primase [bacterium]
MLALGANGSVPVLVPEQLHDEASEIVAGVEASCPTDFDEGGDPDDDEDDDLDHDDLDDDDDFLDDDDDDDDLV